MMSSFQQTEYLEGVQAITGIKVHAYTGVSVIIVTSRSTTI